MCFRRFYAVKTDVFPIRVMSQCACFSVRISLQYAIKKCRNQTYAWNIVGY